MDFTPYLDSKSLRTYSGANGKKVGIVFNGELYLLKFAPIPKNNKALSYTNSPISEHIACTIINEMGFTAQKTILGTVTIRDKEKLVVACKDFCIDGFRLSQFNEIKNRQYDDESDGSGVELEAVLQTIEDQDLLNPKELKSFFWEQFVLDALIGNFDRHNGNWGLLINEETQVVKIAPIYDCGSSLYPQLDPERMRQVLENEDEIDQRIYIFPNSALKMDGKKINMYEFLTETNDQDVKLAIRSVYEKINLSNITKFIENIDEISPLQKAFYIRMIRERKEKILDVAYARTVIKNKTKQSEKRR